jgi:Tol biopolymer transport system component
VDDTNPVPSPDGSRVAFAREVDDDELAIIVRSMDGTERVLQGTTLSAEYAWSPDSALLAAVYEPEALEDATVIFDTGGAATATIQCPGFCSGVSWAPDGRLVIGADDSAELVSLDTGARVQVPGPPETWSPDGGRFAFIREFDAERIELIVVELEPQHEQTIVSMDVDSYIHGWLWPDVTAVWCCGTEGDPTDTVAVGRPGEAQRALLRGNA